MYLCNDCGEEFEVPACEYTYANETLIEDEVEVCPACGSDDIVLMRKRFNV